LAIFFSTNREIVTDFLEVGIFQPERKSTPPDPTKTYFVIVMSFVSGIYQLRSFNFELLIALKW
jgi:hypothetical protein